jgi:hypothetical protein
MREDEAREIIEAAAAKGGRVVPALKAQIPAIKSMLERCLEAGIPALPGPCERGG